MPMRLTAGDIFRARNRVMSLQGKLAGVSKKAEGVIETAIRTTLAGGTAFGMGVVNGRYGGVKLVGVPLDLGVAVTAHLAGFLGLAGRMSGHLHSVADGSLCSYLTTQGRGVGIKMAAKTDGKPALAERIQGELGDLGGQRLTKEELSRLAGGR